MILSEDSGFSLTSMNFNGYGVCTPRIHESPRPLQRARGISPHGCQSHAKLARSSILVSIRNAAETSAVLVPVKISGGCLGTMIPVQTKMLHLAALTTCRDKPSTTRYAEVHTPERSSPKRGGVIVALLGC